MSCTCPRWEPTARDDDGTPADYACPDDDCRCGLHCADDEVCWCGETRAVGCPTHLPAPGGVV